jgi:hypothetical protein
MTTHALSMGFFILNIMSRAHRFAPVFRTDRILLRLRFVTMSLI